MPRAYATDSWADARVPTHASKPHNRLAHGSAPTTHSHLVQREVPAFWQPEPPQHPFQYLEPAIPIGWLIEVVAVAATNIDQQSFG